MGNSAQAVFIVNADTDGQVRAQSSQETYTLNPIESDRMDEKEVFFPPKIGGVDISRNPNAN